MFSSADIEVLLLLAYSWFFKRSATTSMMPPGGVRRIDRELIRRSASKKGCSPNFISIILHILPSILRRIADCPALLAEDFSEVRHVKKMSYGARSKIIRNSSCHVLMKRLGPSIRRNNGISRGNK
jgi:hypothetical protein